MNLKRTFLAIAPLAAFAVTAACPSAVLGADNTWTGSVNNDWDKPGNWSENRVPADGEKFVVKGIAEIFRRVGASACTNVIWTIGAKQELMFKEDSFRIGSGEVYLVRRAGVQSDYAAWGEIIVDPGASLRADGVFCDLSMAPSSTLVHDVGDVFEVTNRAVSVGGINVSIEGYSGQEAVAVLTAPHGSEGMPASVKVGDETLSAAWHGKLDGRMVLWGVGADTGDVAVWKGDSASNNNLVDPDNWDNAVPGKTVAARIDSGEPNMQGNEKFDFARRFTVGSGKSGVAGVRMSGGDICGNGTGAAVIVGADGAQGSFDADGGVVSASDYLWNSAFTVGTNATGVMRVRGGRLNATGGISIGEGGSGRLEVGSGSVSASGPLAIGYDGSALVSGGQITGDSFFIGRSTFTGDVYNVSFDMTGGAVSSGAGAFWVGSYGGAGSRALLTLAGGEISAAKFICGGYRSARVDVTGGKLVAPEICIGYDLTDDDDVAEFNLFSGRIETAGFTSGADGVRSMAISNGVVVATAENGDFFAGMDSVRVLGDVTFQNDADVTMRSALTGPGAFVKRGAGTNTVAGAALWGGGTVVGEGVLDMNGGMLPGDVVVSNGASVVNARYDNMDLLPKNAELWVDVAFSDVAKGTPLGSNTGVILAGCGAWEPVPDGCSAVVEAGGVRGNALAVVATNGASVCFSASGDSGSTYVRMDSTLCAGASLEERACKPGAKCGLEFQEDADSGVLYFAGYSAAGWQRMTFADGTSPVVGTFYDVRMELDGSGDQCYVAYSAKKCDEVEYGRLVSVDGLRIFPAAGSSVRRFEVDGKGLVESLRAERLEVVSGEVFYWIGADGGRWNDGGNWSHEKNGSSAGSYPQAGNTAFIERSVTVALGNAGGDKVGTLVVNSAVAFTGGKALAVGSSVLGAGTLTLDGVTLAAADVDAMADKDVSVEVPLVIAPQTTNVLMACVCNAHGCGFEILKSIDGSGHLSVTQSTGEGAVNAGVNLMGDMSGFTGSIEFYQGITSGSGSVSYQQYAEDSVYPEANAENARWNLYADHWGNIPVGRTSGNYFAEGNATYRFGALKLRLPTTEVDEGYQPNVTLEVGKLDEDSYSVDSWRGAQGCGIRWIAPTATFTNCSANTAFLVAAGGGKLVIGSAAGAPTKRISFVEKGGELSFASGVDVDVSKLLVDSDAPIAFNDGGVDRVWANALASSNVGGFVKRGAGTLTWLAAPASKMDVVVEEGVLVVPFGTQLGAVSVREGASIVVDLANAVAGAVAFSAGGADRRLDEPHLRFVNCPAGYDYKIVRGNGNAVGVVDESRDFTWTGAAGTIEWSDAGNWDPWGVPQTNDTVTFASESCTTVRVDGAVCVMKAAGFGDLCVKGGELSTVLSADFSGFDVALADASIVCGGSFAVRAVAGRGRIEVGGGALSVTTPGGTDYSFVGTIAVTNLVKGGTGRFRYNPAAAHVGEIRIEGGTMLWDCTGLADQSDARVWMAAGATLDLCGQTVKVGSFAGAGTVCNGFLVTADGVVTQTGGSLRIPIVEGTTYVASYAGETLYLDAGDGGDTDAVVDIVIPRTWFVAGASGRDAVFCRSKNIHWHIQRPGSSLRIDGRDGWWSIPCGGFAVRLR